MRPFSVSFLAAVLFLASCQKESSPAPASGLEGTWRLISRQCYCQPGPVPDEIVTFTSSRFIFYKDTRASRLGQYAFATASPLCLSSGNAVPVLRLITEQNFTNPAANNYSTDVQYTVSGNTLTLDYGSPCDFPLDTYERVQ